MRYFLNKCTLLFMVIIVIFLNSCETGYVKINNHWAWVTWNENSGRTVFPLNVDNDSFEILKNEIAKDKYKVFYKQHVLRQADSKTFRVLKNSYSSDKYHVFIDSFLIVNANPKTFEILKYPYSKDENHIFNGSIMLDTKDTNNITIIESDSVFNFIISKEDLINAFPQYSFYKDIEINVFFYSSKGIVKTKSERFVGLNKSN